MSLYNKIRKAKNGYLFQNNFPTGELLNIPIQTGLGIKNGRDLAYGLGYDNQTQQTYGRMSGLNQLMNSGATFLNARTRQKEADRRQEKKYLDDFYYTPRDNYRYDSSSTTPYFKKGGKEEYAFGGIIGNSASAMFNGGKRTNGGPGTLGVYGRSYTPMGKKSKKSAKGFSTVHGKSLVSQRKEKSGYYKGDYKNGSLLGKLDTLQYGGQISAQSTYVDQVLDTSPIKLPNPNDSEAIKFLNQGTTAEIMDSFTNIEKYKKESQAEIKKNLEQLKINDTSTFGQDLKNTLKKMNPFSFQKGGMTQEDIDLLIAEAQNDPSIPEVVAKRGNQGQTVLQGFNKSKKRNNIKEFQATNNLEPTGNWNKQTAEFYYNQDFNSAPVTSEYSTSDVERAKKAKSDYIQRVKTEADKIGEGDFFGMDKTRKENLINSTSKPVYECIGGVCTFLKDKVESSFNTKGGIYHSNFTFAENFNKEGWQEHKDFSMTSPQVGDILQLRGEGNRHAAIVTSFDEKTGKYRLHHNAGGAKAKVKTLDKKGLQDYVKQYGDKGVFYRKTSFDGVDLAKATRKPKGIPALPQEFQDSEFDNSFKNFSIKDKEARAFDRRRKRFNKGLNKELKSAIKEEEYKDIAPQDLRKIALIASTIPAGESEFGKGIKFNIESAFPNAVRKYRDKKGNSRAVEGSPLSVGLSQINPKTGLSSELKEKHFKGMTDLQIEKKLARNAKVSGAVTLDLMVEKYRQQRKDPKYHGEDDSLFWSALIKRHQSPNYFRSGNNNDLNNLPYVNNILSHMNEFEIDQSGKQFLKAGGQFNNLNNTNEIPVSNNGLHDFPDGPVIVPSNSITMKDIDFPVMAYPDKGDPIEMLPGNEYVFPNASKVLEIPKYQKGGEFNEPDFWDPNKESEVFDLTEPDQIQRTELESPIGVDTSAIDVNSLFANNSTTSKPEDPTKIFTPLVYEGLPTSTSSEVSASTAPDIAGKDNSKRDEIYGNTIAVSHNNPGNIKMGKFAAKYGAKSGRKATDGGIFAVFPDIETGLAARRDLLRGKRYRDLTVYKAMKLWSGGGKDESRGYGDEIYPQLKGKLIKDLTDQELTELQGRQVKREDRMMYKKLLELGYINK